MKCNQCGKNLTQHYVELRHTSYRTVTFFCDLSCLRDFLPPPAPLTDRINQAQNHAPSPQHMVFDLEIPFQHEGESRQAYWERVLSGELIRVKQVR